MKAFCKHGSSLYVDNYYCHVGLAEKMLAEGFNITGTYRISRKDIPGIVKNAVVKKTVRKSNSSNSQQSSNSSMKNIRYFKSDNGIFVVKWMSKREVNVLTTNHSLKLEEEETSRNRTIIRPEAVNEYIKFMRGIDRLNQKVHYIR